MWAAWLGSAIGCEMLSLKPRVSKGCRARLPLPAAQTHKKRFLSQNFTNVQSNPRHSFVNAVANQSKGENFLNELSSGHVQKGP